MTESPLATAQCLFAQALDALRGVAEAGSAGERLSVLTLCEAMARQLDQVTVDAVATLDRDGVFAERGYTSPVQALSDLLGWERFEARRRVTAAEQVTPRTGLDGAALPARLPATAQVFAAGRASLRHVEVIARVLRDEDGRTAVPAAVGGRRGAARRSRGRTYTPRELHEWGTALVELLDQDGEATRRPAARPDQRAVADPAARRWREDQAVGSTTPAMFDAIATVIDAHAKPLTADDDRSRRASGRPRRWPTCAATSSTTATSPSAAGTART